MGLLDQAYGNPLTHLGAGLLNSGRPMTSTNLSDFNRPGRGIGAGLLTGMGSYGNWQQQQEQMANRRGLLGVRQGELAQEQAEYQVQLKQQEQKQQAEQAFRLALQQPPGTLPPEQLKALAFAAAANPASVLPTDPKLSSAAILGR